MHIFHDEKISQNNKAKHLKVKAANLSWYNKHYKQGEISVLYYLSDAQIIQNLLIFLENNAICKAKLQLLEGG